MRLADDQDPAGQFAAQRPDQALADRVRPGACGGLLTIRRAQDSKTASNCPVNWPPRGDLARFAFLLGGNDGEHLLRDTS